MVAQCLRDAGSTISVVVLVTVVIMLEGAVEEAALDEDDRKDSS